MLNSLIGANDMRKAVGTIWQRDKSAFNVMDILIAVRSEGQKKSLIHWGIVSFWIFFLNLLMV